ncbi:Root hair specific 16 [Heracleum sosnowskyi]|uniref:non-specific serine/threonine protein kinase n=1 Tax=Heracleum sosnowskyi TaxID=360622 RepID=A0AAD8M5G4_9APIA|nr:Root hair specific 16 [Heracleum sosnowskyi]
MLSKYYYLLLFTLVLEYSLNQVLLVHAQDDNPPGFVSIDCGLPEGSDYKESTTGIYYESDANLIDSGESKSLSSSFSSEKYLSSVRSFPQGKKNCYTIQPSPGKGHKYLIRATFLYGNYDSLNQFPTFDLNLGPDTWSNVIIRGHLIPVEKEIIHVLSSDYLHVCLIKTGTTTPFISALELRPLDNTDSMYTIDNGSLQTFNHIDCSQKTDSVIRYKNDSYDRRWIPLNLSNTGISTSLDVDNRKNNFRVPESVLRTACTPDRTSEPLRFYWNATTTSDQFYLYFHFAEVEKLEANQSREFNVYINDQLGINQRIVLPYLTVSSIYSLRPQTGSTRYTITLSKTENSTLPPILNAFEIYTATKISNSGTSETDVSAILNIKSTYKVIRDWQGDPCEPEDSLWDGLRCSYPSSNHSARIISLNLSTSGLTGEIVDSIANLTQLKTLDLSNNDLNGQVPEFLCDLPLSVLNLKGNKFTGPIPAQLLENGKKGILSLSHDGSEDEKKNSVSTPAVVGIVFGLVVFLAAILIGIWILRRRTLRDTVLLKPDSQTQEKRSKIERKDRQFTYSEVQDITRNFQRVLGEGAFGTVYHGYIGDIQVAVKMLSASSTQGQREFETEASLLMSVSHKNVTSLVGYCNESTYMGIIYEYMANRSLDEHLSGRSCDILSWQIRLQIALDVAEGLEYLHHGCRPAIIHRDVKTSNILLNEKFRANLGDFGLSKAYPAEGGTHVVTGVAGTPGYIDPEYYNSSKLTEKSDVFSFGVVLLEIITGRPALLTNRTPIAQWVHSIVRNGDVKQVLDPRLRGKYDRNSAWKAVELALTCASRTSSDRPPMNIVVLEIKDCLVIKTSGEDAKSDDIIGMVTVDVDSSLLPEPR